MATVFTCVADLLISFTHSFALITLSFTSSTNCHSAFGKTWLHDMRDGTILMNNCIWIFHNQFLIYRHLQYLFVKSILCKETILAAKTHFYSFKLYQNKLYIVKSINQIFPELSSKWTKIKVSWNILPLKEGYTITKFDSLSQ